MSRTSGDTLDPDRLLPPEEPVLGYARELYESVQALPIISPHGHIPVDWFSHNRSFKNPTDLFITPDHYVTRILHSHGVSLADLGVNQHHFSDEQARHAFELFGKYWFAFAGTPMRYWFEDSLANVFGIVKKFGPDTALAIYDELSELLGESEFATRSLVGKFNIEFISTTDDPVDDLLEHDQVNQDPAFPARVAPAFRPDKYLEPARADWPRLVEQLGESAGVDTGDYRGFTEAMRRRRAFFKEHGAVLTDHSHFDAGTQRLDESEAQLLYEQSLAGSIDARDAARLRRHLLNDQATLAQEDGLVMTLHPAVYRNYDPENFARYGADTGADIPARAEFVEHLAPVLHSFGSNPDFHLVVFTIDETVYSRELAPLAGFYPSVFIGAPWWFIDAPESINRYFAQVVPYAGFSKLSGFIDDTRAICSIPARHDMNRRLTAGYVAGLVAEHRISMDEGLELVNYAVDFHPREVFKID